MEVNGKEYKTGEKGRMSKVEVEINGWKDYVRK